MTIVAGVPVALLLTLVLLGSALAGFSVPNRSRGRLPTSTERAQIVAAIDTFRASRPFAANFLECMLESGGICISVPARSNASTLRQSVPPKKARLNIGRALPDGPKLLGSTLVHEATHVYDNSLDQAEMSKKERECRAYYQQWKFLRECADAMGATTPGNVTAKIQRIEGWYPNFAAHGQSGAIGYPPVLPDDQYPKACREKIWDTPSPDDKEVCCWTDASGTVHVQKYSKDDDDPIVIEQQIQLGVDIVTDFDVRFNASGVPVVVAVGIVASTGAGRAFVLTDADQDGLPDAVSDVLGGTGTLSDPLAVAPVTEDNGMIAWYVLDRGQGEIRRMPDADGDIAPDNLGAAFATAAFESAIDSAVDIDAYGEMDANGMVLPPVSVSLQSWAATRTSVDETDWVVALRDSDGDGLADSTTGVMQIGNDVVFSPYNVNTMFAGDASVQVYGAIGHVIEIRIGKTNELLGSTIVGPDHQGLIPISPPLKGGRRVYFRDATEDLDSPMIVVESVKFPTVWSIDNSVGPPSGGEVVTLTGRFLGNTGSVVFEAIPDLVHTLNLSKESVEATVLSWSNTQIVIETPAVPDPEGVRRLKIIAGTQTAASNLIFSYRE